jgi:hypothetical protein
MFITAMDIGRTSTIYMEIIVICQVTLSALGADAVTLDCLTKNEYETEPNDMYLAGNKRSIGEDAGHSNCG